MKEIIISIIVPVYNAQKYLETTIKSILNQTFINIELILVNDGSNDDSLAICEKYKHLDERVVVVDKKNEGVSVARNTGIKLARGKYIMFADSDDFVDINWCNCLYEFVKRNKNSLVICGYSKEIHNRKKKIVFNNEEEYSIVKKSDFFHLYLSNLTNNPWNKIFKTSIIKKNNIEFNKDLTLGEDLLFVLEYMKYVDNKIIVVNKELYYYIIRLESSLDNKYYSNLLSIYKLLYSNVYNCIEIFDTNFNEIKELYFNNYLMMMIRVLNNTFRKESKLTFYEKIKYNKKIIESIEFKNIVQGSNISKYKRILNSHNYFVIHFYFITLNNIKKKIKRIFKL